MKKPKVMVGQPVGKGADGVYTLRVDSEEIEISKKKKWEATGEMGKGRWTVLPSGQRGGEEGAASS